MKNKTIATLIILCNLLTPSSVFAGSGNCQSLSKYDEKVEFIKNIGGSKKPAKMTLKIISDKLNELVNLIKLKNGNVELDSNQQQEYLKNVKFLTFSYSYPRARSKFYVKKGQVNRLFNGLDDFMFHPIYMLMNPGSGLNFGWITCKKLPEMLSIFVTYIDAYRQSGYIEDKLLFVQHLRRMVGFKLEQILKIKDFYKIYAQDFNTRLTMFENIIILNRGLGMPKELALKHLEFVVEYARSLAEEDEGRPSNSINKEDSTDKKIKRSKSYDECLKFLKHERLREKQARRDEFLRRIREIVAKNIECFADSTEEKLIIMLKTK